ncbi:ankyrin [Rhodofomes roseus]|uniref:Ankyrin n=1 Tax=Rhodofomes roseus TaxID=34475 RepID=A0ABQ8K153_9APHY|nr:ankyrin [Rhodofomes roseus]KAH9830437.1 ankyrin [Rhodofomes roseus]
MADGASNNERLLAAARTDNEELLLEVFEEGKFDINYQDGLGNTALHYAASHGSLAVLEHILSHDECDVDPVNRLEKATPLHLAMRMEDEELRTSVVESLLDAGADTTIKDKHGETAFDLLRDDDTEIRQLMRKARAQNSISNADIANDDDDDEAGSGSGSGSEDED